MAVRERLCLTGAAGSTTSMRRAAAGVRKSCRAARTPKVASRLGRRPVPEQAIRVIDPYLIEVTLDGAAPRPVSNREAIRAQGPTVRLDLGKQAELA